MKWFKHISDSLDDPKIFELLRRHKADGYLVFFGILEIYAREFKTDDGWMLHTSTHYLKQKLQGYHTNRLTIILQSIQDLFSWTVNLEGDNLEIYVPKFRKYLDESTLKKLRAAEKNSGSIPERVPENVRIEEEEEVEVEEEVDKEKCSEPQEASELCVIEFPIISKNGQGNTFQFFSKDIDEWSDVFPALNILGRLKFYRQWSVDNPTKRKTHRGIRKHITNWLERDQNSGKYYTGESKEKTLEPKTYAQAQDMERRQMVRALLEDQENEQTDNQEGTDKVSGLLPSS